LVVTPSESVTVHLAKEGAHPKTDMLVYEIPACKEFLVRVRR
jgi:hypothetical protein